MISVIVPVYNGETYLRPCLDSVINQTIGMENIEIALINDASTDSSLDILEEYHGIVNIRTVSKLTKLTVA